ncbi:MAG TPA: alpha/beta fold hydrolase [Methanoregula sp.]|nr:alpha/beta fold hydrolase [Methanoregula sp.]
MVLPPPAFVSIDGIRIAYRAAGSGYPLVLINGLASPMDTWNPPVLERLSRYHRLIIFDPRGTGFSGSSEEPCSISLFACDVLHLMDALGIDRADILGFSLGASVAQELAIGSPGRVRKLVLVGGSCGGKDAEGPDPEVWRRLIDRSGPADELASRIFSLIFPAGWLEDHDPLMYCPEVSETTPPGEVIRQAESFLSWPGSYNRLDRIRSDVLVIAGLEDAVIPPENSILLSEKIPGARLVLFRGAGHGLMYQCRDRFCECVGEFLED